MKRLLIVFLLSSTFSYSQAEAYPDKESRRIINKFLHDTDYAVEVKDLYFEIQEDKQPLKSNDTPHVQMPIATTSTTSDDWYDYQWRCMWSTFDWSDLQEIGISMKESRLYGYNTLDSLVAVCVLTDRIYLLENAIIDFLLENGSPSVQYFDKNSQAQYDGETNFIYLPDSLGIEDGIFFLVEETTHAYQWKNYADIYNRNLFDHFGAIVRSVENKTSISEEKTKEYHMPGTLEHDAHTILSPILRQQLCDIILCYLN